MLIKHFPTILKISDRKKWKLENAHLLPKVFPGPSKHVVWFSTTFCAIKSLGIANFSKFGQIKKSSSSLRMHPRQIQETQLKENIFLRHKKSVHRVYFGKKCRKKSAHLFTVSFPGQNKNFFVFFRPCPLFFVKWAMCRSQAPRSLRSLRHIAHLTKKSHFSWQ